MTDKDKIIERLERKLALRNRQLDDALEKLDRCYTSLAEERAIENEMARRRTWAEIQKAQFQEV